MAVGMRLYALSDLHVDHPANREALGASPAHPDDWLILGGDIAHTLELSEWTFSETSRKWARVFWVPGNHDLWAVPAEGDVRGVSKYDALVALARKHGVVTPEDDYVEWPDTERPTRIAPLFLLYDYSYAPEGMSPADAKAWAREHEIVCTDEFVLHPDPHASREAWCAVRIAETLPRLEEAARTHELVLVNHFPMREDQIRLRMRLHRFRIWCGTRATADWHRRFRARVVVSGHLHVPWTANVDGVRFEEVSVGYPRDWNVGAGLDRKLRRIL
jgi:3',5'-cyclic AMP phosphodiesterase CpdA